MNGVKYVMCDTPKTIYTIYFSGKKQYNHKWHHKNWDFIPQLQEVEKNKCHLCIDCCGEESEIHSKSGTSVGKKYHETTGVAGCTV